MYFCLPFIGTIFPRNKPVLISLHTYHPYFYLILLIHGFVRFIRGLNGMRLFYFFKKKKKNITLAPIKILYGFSGNKSMVLSHPPQMVPLFLNFSFQTKRNIGQQTKRGFNIW